MKLFIIGNGFDKAHGMKTSYNDFREYLKMTYPDADDSCITAPQGYSDRGGGIDYYDSEAVSYLLSIISNVEPDYDKWKDLENSLGYLEYAEYLPNWNFMDKDGSADHWAKVYAMQDEAANISGVTRKFLKYLADWINTIDINISIKKSFSALIDNDQDIFLNFNYTRTLEVLYEIKNVYHIHGVQGGGELVFGHGNTDDLHEEYMNNYTGSESSISDIHNFLRKDTDSVINSNIDFFDIVSSNIEQVYSFGFSFSEVDAVYIKEICKRIDTEKVTWYINDFDKDNSDNFKKIIISQGFKGNFDTYHIS